MTCGMTTSRTPHAARARSDQPDSGMIQQHERLAEHARDLAEVALANITREYPHVMLHTMAGPGDRPQPRDIHPAFYGSFDWHSCVEMHWLLVRLLRTVPEQVPQERIRA